MIYSTSYVHTSEMEGTLLSRTPRKVVDCLTGRHTYECLPSLNGYLPVAPSLHMVGSSTPAHLLLLWRSIQLWKVIRVNYPHSIETTQRLLPSENDFFPLLKFGSAQRDLLAVTGSLTRAGASQILWARIVFSLSDGMSKLGLDLPDRVQRYRMMTTSTRRDNDDNIHCAHCWCIRAYASTTRISIAMSAVKEGKVKPSAALDA